MDRVVILDMDGTEYRITTPDELSTFAGERREEVIRETSDARAPSQTRGSHFFIPNFFQFCYTSIT